MLLFLATVFSGRPDRQLDRPTQTLQLAVIQLLQYLLLLLWSGIVDGLPHPAITTVYVLSAATWNGLDRRRPSSRSRGAFLKYPPLDLLFPDYNYYFNYKIYYTRMKIVLSDDRSP